MDIKVNRYFLILSIFSIFLVLCNFFILDNKNINNLYMGRVENIFDDLNNIEIIFESEIYQYFDSNVFSKYTIKEIRDGYTDIKINAVNLIDELENGGYQHTINKKYLIYILKEVLSIIDNNFLKDSIFSSSNEMVIRNVQNIIDKLKKVTEKYNLFKFNLGLRVI